MDSRGVSVQWVTVTLGVGGIAGNGPLTLQPRVSASLDVVRAGVADSALGTDSATGAGFGVHAGADVVFQLDPVGFVASLDAWHLGASTHIIVKGQPAGLSTANGWAAGLGLRFFLE